MMQLPANALRVPPTYRTVPDYCGPAVLRCLIKYWTGQAVDEVTLARALRTKRGSTLDSGSSPEAMAILLARDYGLAAELREGTVLDDLRTALARGVTVVVNFQAWTVTDQPVPLLSYPDDGHYTVLIAMDDEHLYMMDPSLEEGYGYVPIKDFEPRWYDVNATKRYDQAAIFVEGETPHPVVLTGTEPLTLIP